MKAQCPACQSSRTISGRYLSQTGGSGFALGLGSVFRPKGLKALSMTGTDIHLPDGDAFSSCLDCGLIWSKIDHEKLEKVIRKKGTERTKKSLGFTE